MAHVTDYDSIFRDRERVPLADAITRFALLAGVYVLYDADGRCIYVGQSADVGHRLREHSRNQRMTSAKSVSVVPEDSLDKRLELEGIEILRARPPLNQALLLRICADGSLVEIRCRRSRKRGA